MLMLMLIGLWGPKSNNKIIKSINSSLGIVLELAKTYPKRIYRRKNAHVNDYWNVKADF